NSSSHVVIRHFVPVTRGLDHHKRPPELQDVFAACSPRMNISETLLRVLPMRSPRFGSEGTLGRPSNHRSFGTFRTWNDGHRDFGPFGTRQLGPWIFGALGTVAFWLALNLWFTFT